MVAGRARDRLRTMVVPAGGGLTKGKIYAVSSAGGRRHSSPAVETTRSTSRPGRPMEPLSPSTARLAGPSECGARPRPRAAGPRCDCGGRRRACLVSGRRADCLLPLEQPLVASATGNKPTELTLGTGSSYSPSWSPDGRRIAFIQESTDHQIFNIWVLYPRF